MKSVWLIGLLLAGGGCMKTLLACTNLAQPGTSYVCKHCNCLMPTDIAPDAKCPACDCGYAAAKCRRGA